MPELSGLMERHGFDSRTGDAVSHEFRPHHFGHWRREREDYTRSFFYHVPDPLPEP